MIQVTLPLREADVNTERGIAPRMTRLVQTFVAASSPCPSELSVRAAGFAPVKGMRHLAHDRVELDGHGPVGDRAWCLVDVAARQVLRTVQHPTLMAVVARIDGDLLEITMPSRESVAATPALCGRVRHLRLLGPPVALALTSGPHAGLVSDFLRRDVRLAAAPRGGVVFAAPVTIIGTASVQACRSRPAGRSRAVPGDTGRRDRRARDRGHVAGAEVRVGEATLRVGGPVPRCGVVDHDPVTGLRDARLLKALVHQRPVNRAGEPMFGVYAEVGAGRWSSLGSILGAPRMPSGSPARGRRFTGRWHGRLGTEGGRERRYFRLSMALSHPKGRILGSNDFLSTARDRSTSPAARSLPRSNRLWMCSRSMTGSPTTSTAWAASPRPTATA